MEDIRQYRCLVLEDEKIGQGIIKEYISRIEWLSLSAFFESGDDTLAAIQKEQFDILFLDINVPGVNGIELAKKAANTSKVIFTTASPEFAVEGFELDAVDYLVKPFSFERFQKAIAKLLHRNIDPTKSLSNEFENAFIHIKSGGNLIKVKLNEICLVESQRNMLIIHLTNKQLQTYGTINEFEDRLPKGKFVRIHKSFIISLDKIESFNASSVTIASKCFPIGRNFKDEALSAIKQHLT